MPVAVSRPVYCINHRGGSDHLLVSSYVGVAEQECVKIQLYQVSQQKAPTSEPTNEETSSVVFDRAFRPAAASQLAAIVWMTPFLETARRNPTVPSCAEAR